MDYKKANYYYTVTHLHTRFSATEQHSMSHILTKYHLSFKVQQCFSTFVDNVFSESDVMAAQLDKPFQDPDQYTRTWSTHFHVSSFQGS